jgi:neutral ceramidase
MRIVVEVILSLVVARSAGAELRAGVARVEITPSSMMTMYGYANRKCGPANGTHDPLMAKVLVLEAGGSRMAIVTTDLGSLVSDSLRQDVASKLGISILLLSASHTHSAPAFLPFGSAPATTPGAVAYRAEVDARIFGAVEAALQTLAPATLSVARGSIQLGYNRLLPRDDGRTRALFDNLERVPYGPVDPEIVLLRVDDTSGRPRALLVHYATHAVVLGPTNCKYSADYPGVLQARTEAAVPGAQVMFVQGGAGDINPIFMARSGDEEKDFGVVEKMGELLAEEVVRANRTAAPVAAGVEGITAKSEIVSVKDRWDPTQSIDVGITTVLINRTIAIAAWPGEVMHVLQKDWKARAEVAVPLFYGYTFSAGGTWAGYVPDLRTAAHGGYGADASTRVEIGTGERLLERHLVNLYGLLGMWMDKQGKP